MASSEYYSTVHLTIVYLVICVFQYLYFNGYFKKYIDLIYSEKSTERDNIKYNADNHDNLNKLFSKVLEERIKMLDKMSYEEWIDYNNKNIIISSENYKYYISIYESTGGDKDSEFILRASANDDATGLSYSDLIQQEKFAFIFSSFAPNKDLISVMNKLTPDNNGLNNLSFYALDYNINKAVKKHSIVGKWKKKLNNNNVLRGVITVGYILKDVEKDYSNTYFNYSNKYFLLVISLVTYISSILLHYSKYSVSIIKPLIFLITLNIYLTMYFSTNEGITSFETEQAKFTDINSGVLSLSFLTGVNTYILDKFKTVKNSKFVLNTETSLYFLIAILLMLASLYKVNNYSSIDGIRTSRIDIQCMYNMCIIINFYVLFNYLVYLGIESKLVKLL